MTIDAVSATFVAGRRAQLFKIIEVDTKGLTKCTTNGFVGSLFSDDFLGYLYIKNSYNPLFLVGV
jgi:hypothetical protein